MTLCLPYNLQVLREQMNQLGDHQEENVHRQMNAHDSNKETKGMSVNARWFSTKDLHRKQMVYDIRATHRQPQ